MSCEDRDRLIHAVSWWSENLLTLCSQEEGNSARAKWARVPMGWQASYWCTSSVSAFDLLAHIYAGLRRSPGARSERLNWHSSLRLCVESAIKPSSRATRASPAVLAKAQAPIGWISPIRARMASLTRESRSSFSISSLGNSKRLLLSSSARVE